MKNIEYTLALETVLARTGCVDTERIPLIQCSGRVLAEELIVAEDIPPFDRSPYDGYALRAKDVRDATPENPITLRIIDEVPAGALSHVEVTVGTAVKILTGAQIPIGADCVIMYEKTVFTAEAVTIDHPLRSGENIVYAGEDVKKGTVLAFPGTVIDAGLMGSLAAQNVCTPLVYKKPRIGILSTGSELTPLGKKLKPGKIYDTNLYSIAAAVTKLGADVVAFDFVKDETDVIAEAMNKALSQCDILITTGGVSAGDYDLTPEAMEKIGAEILFRGVKLKPGMACAYAVREGKLICGLSGNPASSLVNLYVIAACVIRKFSGCSQYDHEMVTLCIDTTFKKGSPATRVLRGSFYIREGRAMLHVPLEQGNAVLSSAIGCNAVALVPPRKEGISAGTELQGFLI